MAVKKSVKSFSRATPAEVARLDQELAPEREWYLDAPRYATNEDLERAFRTGALAEVKSDDSIQLVKRFYDYRDRFKPFLTPTALGVLQLFSATWRSEISDEMDASRLRLAITSMARSDAHQQEIIAEGTLASADSTHVAAGAFDVDVSGYYSFTRRGTLVSQGHPGRRQQQDVQRELLLQADPTLELPDYEYAYDQRVADAAIRAAELLQNFGVINLVHEFADTPNACLHMAANPNI